MKSEKFIPNGIASRFTLDLKLKNSKTQKT